jgi:beta-ureidopropionase / N-carbamoyl-L-amino-acid hydrolase
MPEIDGRRLLAELRALARIGAYRTGVHRPTYSPQDIEARHWLAARMHDAGLEPEIDGIGNVLGRSRAPGLKLLVGSHVETQNHAGWLDGAMGVVFGLEVARAFAADPACNGLGIDVAAWADEEGHYGDFLGSRSFCGTLSDEDIDRCTNRHDGTPLREALAAAGLANRQRARIERERYRGYLEAHVEQGRELDDRGLRVGIVTAISGRRAHSIVFTGIQNHAGTTRMAIRKDAGVALVRMAAAIDREFPRIAGPHTVWTCSRITLEPGMPGVVPGRAEMLFQFNDCELRMLETLSGRLEALRAEAAAGPCAVEVTRTFTSVPTQMDPTLQDRLERAALRRAPGLHQRMPSGAGHDAQILAGVMPAAMLFVPSIGGVSHHYAENTNDDDLVLGCAVLADAAADILRTTR